MKVKFKIKANAPASRGQACFEAFLSCGRTSAPWTRSPGADFMDQFRS
jgi:hypothetical protein